LQVTLKVTYGQDVFRFTLQEKPTYKSIMQLIIGVWPSLSLDGEGTGAKQRVTYIDDEGDACTLTSVTFEDFLQGNAVTGKNTLLKLEIQAQMPQPNEQAGSDKPCVSEDVHLRSMMAEGKMTKEQALEKMAAYKAGVATKTMVAGRSVDPDDIGMKLRNMTAQGNITEEHTRERMAAMVLRTMMAQGNITEEQACERMAAMKEKIIDGRSRHPDAVGMKLRTIMAKGNITEEQARERMAAFKRGSSEEAKLCAMMPEGRMSKEQALEKMAACKRGALKEEMVGGRSGDTDAIGLKLRAMMGDIPEQQAREKMAAYKRGAFAEMKVPDMLAEGKMTKEQALEMMAACKRGALKEKMVSGRCAESDAIGLKLRGRIAKGDITEEQAHEKMAAYKRGAFPEMKGRDMMGKMTKEQALEKMAACRQGAVNGKLIHGRSTDADAIGIKLRAMMAKGDITEEQAHAKMAGLLCTE